MEKKPGPMNNTIHIANMQRKYRVDSQALKRALDTVLSILKCRKRELSVALVSRARMRSINAQYRQTDRATDVLSFPGGEDPRDSFLGEIVVCLDVLRCQAGNCHDDGRPKTHTLGEELALMMIHSLLHLKGMHHETDPLQAQAMIRREHEIYNKVVPLFPRVNIVSRSLSSCHQTD